MKLSSRITNSEPLLIKRIAAETTELLKQNHRIINLSQGTPNLPIFDLSSESVKTLLLTKKLPYCDVTGLPEARATCASFINKFYLNDNQPQLVCNNIIITNGAVQAIHNILALCIDSKTDIVASPLPAYGLYKYQTQMLGGTFTPIETQLENGFVPSVDDLRQFFDAHSSEVDGKKTTTIRAIVLCYPNNPTGSSLNVDDAKELAMFLDEMLESYGEDGGFCVILDEVYFGTSISGRRASIFSYASERLRQSIFLVLSGSKGLGAMPGARAGFCACPNTSLVLEMQKIQGATTANISTLSQHALMGSLQHFMHLPDDFDRIASFYAERTSLVVDRLNEIGSKYLSDYHVAKRPQGTFYVFAHFSKLTALEDDLQITNYFRDMYKTGRQIGVALVPGSAFGMESKDKLVRFSCAADMADLKLAMDLIEEGISSLMSKESDQQ